MKKILKIIVIIFYILVLIALINSIISGDFEFSVDNEAFFSFMLLISPIFMYYIFKYIKSLFKKREENRENYEKSMKSISDTFEAFRDALTPEYICQNCGAETTRYMFGSWSLSTECRNMGKNACVPVKNPKFKG